jgi:hypothetical protein
MSKTWDNVECEFFTGNTANDMGDSKYIVLQDGMQRTALINFRRAPNQVLSGNPSICYIAPDSHLFDAVYENYRPGAITIASVTGDRILVRVERGPIEPFFGEATRVPANGLSTFDFVNQNGVLSHVHFGHEVKLLSLGRPRRKSV